MTTRRNELADALAPRAADRHSAADAILEMFYCWPDTRRMEAGKAAATAAKYLETLEGLPLWSIQAGCRKLAKQDSAWPPSAGELRAAAVATCQAPRDELGDLQRILGAHVYEAGSAEERRRVVDGFEQLAKDIAGTNATIAASAKPKPRASLHSRFDDAKAQKPPGSLPPLSDAARTAAGYAPRQDIREAAE